MVELLWTSRTDLSRAERFMITLLTNDSGIGCLTGCEHCRLMKSRSCGRPWLIYSPSAGSAPVQPPVERLKKVISTYWYYSTIFIIPQLKILNILVFLINQKRSKISIWNIKKQDDKQRGNAIKEQQKSQLFSVIKFCIQYYKNIVNLFAVHLSCSSNPGYCNSQIIMAR